MARMLPGQSLDIFPAEDNDEPESVYSVDLVQSEGFWEHFTAKIQGREGIGIIALSPNGKSRWIKHPDDDTSSEDTWRQGQADN